MFNKLEEDMDINCGEILDGTVSVQEMGQKIFELFLRTASGEASKSEKLGLPSSTVPSLGIRTTLMKSIA